MYIDEIIRLEWEMFQQAQNVGGRADCQENPEMFRLMRESQFAAWTEPLLTSYLHDLQAARREKRNLLAEKYAWMMEHTFPEEFTQLRDRLPALDPEKERLIGIICSLHVAWFAKLAARYPKLTGRGRPIHSSEDSPAATSFETYLRGELRTYSSRTVRLYAAYVQQLRRERWNLNEEILRNMVERSGFSSLAAA